MEKNTSLKDKIYQELKEEKLYKNKAEKKLYKNRTEVDKVVKNIFLLLALICASFVIFITIFIAIKGIYPFLNNYSTIDGGEAKQSLWSFFTNSRWLYDGTGGMVFLLLTTLYVTLLSLIISVPTSIFTALFLVRIVNKRFKEILKTGIELLASIPSVIYGLFGVGAICPIVANLGVETYGGRSILSGVIVLALMSIPTITMLSITSIEAVDKKLVEASIALGASNAQTNIKVVLKAAKSGIFAGIILGIGRVLGEATAVQMVIGNNSLGTGFLNVFNPGNTLTSAMLAGIGEAYGIGYDVRFSLGLVLIILILVVSMFLNFVKNKIGEQDEKPMFNFLKIFMNKRKKDENK